jgi:hypothetical protein
MDKNLFGFNWHRRSRSGGQDNSADIWLMNGKSSYLAVNWRLMERLKIPRSTHDGRSIIQASFALEDSTGMKGIVLAVFNPPKEFFPKVFVSGNEGHSFIHFNRGLVVDIVNHLKLDPEQQRHNFRVVQSPDYSMTRELYILQKFDE